MRLQLLLLLSFFAPSITNAQNTFAKLYNGNPSGGVAKCFATLPDGGFLIGGQIGVVDSPFIGKTLLKKVDAWGNEVWEHRDFVAGFDYINDIVVYDANTIYCAVAGGSNMWLQKRDMQGEILSAKNLFPHTDTCSEPLSMKKTQDGNLIISGAHYDCGVVNFIVLKVDTNANILWKIQLPAWPYFKNALDIAEAEDSSFVFTGFSNNAEPTPYPYHGDNAMFGKVSNDGTNFFYKTIPLANYPSNEGRAIVALPENKFLIAGRISTLPQYLPEPSFFITDDTGHLISSYVDSTGYKDECIFSAKLLGNHIYLLEAFNHGQVPNDSSVDFKIIVYDFMNDSILFKKYFPQIGYQFPKDLEVLPNGNMAVLYEYTWDDCPQCIGLAVLDSNACAPEWCTTSVLQPESTRNILVYPNPFYQYFQLSGIENADVRLFDYTGNVVFTKNDVGNNKRIEVPELPTGLYFIETKKGDIQWTKKLMHLN